MPKAMNRNSRLEKMIIPQDLDAGFPLQQASKNAGLLFKNGKAITWK